MKGLKRTTSGNPIGISEAENFLFLPKTYLGKGGRGENGGRRGRQVSPFDEYTSSLAREPHLGGPPSARQIESMIASLEVPIVMVLVPDVFDLPYLACKSDYIGRVAYKIQ